MTWTLDDIPDLDGKVCIVTGANAGLGFATARLLAEKRATVILACRNSEKAEAAVAKICAAIPGANVRARPLDVANFASVRDFALHLGSEYDYLDILINNAGLMVPPLSKTVDGFELQFGTNYLGHFLLTGLLLPLLNKAPAARVVSLSSMAHRVGRINFDNLNAERSYLAWGAYAQSKLACLMFALELQRRLEKTGEHTISLVAHPGATSTDLGRNSVLFYLMDKFVTQSARDGAQPTLRAAFDSAAHGGEFYGPGGLLAMNGPAVVETPAKHALDRTVAERLWTVSEQMSGISYP